MFTNYYKPSATGVVSSISLLKHGLEELGHEVYVFTFSHLGYKDKEKGIIRIGSIKFEKNNEFDLMLPSFGRSIKTIKSLDVIHSHHPVIMGWFGSFFAELYNKPHVFTYHSQYENYSIYIPFEQRITKKVTKKIIKNYANKCNCVISPSESIKNIILEQGINTRIDVVPTGINLEQFKNGNGLRIREKHKIPRNKKILLYAGRIAKEKNIDLIIRSFNLIAKKRNDVVLVILGKGIKKMHLRLLVNKLRLKKNVVLAGFSESVQDYYDAADLFVFSSPNETQGLVLVEAMASGKPVVAVESAGANDIINGNNGLLAKNSVKDFSSKITKILDDDDLRKSMSEEAVKTSERFSTEIMSKKIESIYKSLLD